MPRRLYHPSTTLTGRVVAVRTGCGFVVGRVVALDTEWPVVERSDGGRFLASPAAAHVPTRLERRRFAERCAALPRPSSKETTGS